MIVLAKKNSGSFTYEFVIDFATTSVNSIKMPILMFLMGSRIGFL